MINTWQVSHLSATTSSCLIIFGLDPRRFSAGETGRRASFWQIRKEYQWSWGLNGQKLCKTRGPAKCVLYSYRTKSSFNMTFNMETIRNSSGWDYKSRQLRKVLSILHNAGILLTLEKSVVTSQKVPLPLTYFDGKHSENKQIIFQILL